MSTVEPALTPEEAARRLGMNAEVIRRMCRDGRLPAAKIGRVWRIRPADLEAMFGVWTPADRWGKS
jgi:excisionase family DNA binding protein